MKLHKHQFSIFNTKASFNILWFLLVYALLSGWFYVYVGITSPGGKWYFSFLDHYLNLPAWLTGLLATSAKGLLQLVGFTVYQHAPNNVTIAGSRGVSILWACLGFGVMSFWVAFVTAHKATWQYKAKWCAAGVAMVTALNIFRIALIAVANHYHWEVITSVEPHEAFNIASYALLFGMIGWFVWKYGKGERREDRRSKATPEPMLSAVVSNL